MHKQGLGSLSVDHIQFPHEGLFTFLTKCTYKRYFSAAKDVIIELIHLLQLVARHRTQKACHRVLPSNKQQTLAVTLETADHPVMKLGAWHGAQKFQSFAQARLYYS